MIKLLNRKELNSALSLEDFIGVYEDEAERIDRYSSFLNYETNQAGETL